MLRQAKDLNDYKLGARDGEIGKVKEFYFDDQSWAVRYLVADTSGWLSGRRVLISPYALDPASKNDKIIPVDLTRKQIENSPSLDAVKPVSRQSKYNTTSTTAGRDIGVARICGGTPHTLPVDNGGWSETTRHAKNDDPHLRSTKDVTGRTIQARDGEIGDVDVLSLMTTREPSAT
jgi:hypothetical protein